MKKILTALLLLIGLSSYGQNLPMVGQFRSDTTGGERVEFLHSSPSRKGQITEISTPRTVSDSLSNYTKKQDGLISGGSATIGTGSVTIDTAIYRINGGEKMSLPRTFTGIANSPTGTQYYLVVYGELGGTLDTISGVRDTIAVIPNNPTGTVKINTVLVGDGGVESSQPDLTNYVTTDTEQFISGEKTFSSILTASNGIKVNRGSISYIDLSPSNSTHLWRIYTTSAGQGDKSFSVSDSAGNSYFRIDNLSKNIDGYGNINIPSGSNYLIDGVPIGGGSSYTFTSPLIESAGVVSIDLLSIPITDSDIISALTGATYSNNRSTITPAGSKIMYAGQLYDDGTYTYIAISNNSIRRW